MPGVGQGTPCLSWLRITGPPGCAKNLAVTSTGRGLSRPDHDSLGGCQPGGQTEPRTTHWSSPAWGVPWGERATSFRARTWSALKGWRDDRTGLRPQERPLRGRWKARTPPPETAPRQLRARSTQPGGRGIWAVSTLSQDPKAPSAPASLTPNWTRDGPGAPGSSRRRAGPGRHQRMPLRLHCPGS